VNHYERHIELVEASNAARTEDERRIAEARLAGFREAMSMLTGVHPGNLLMLADMHYIDKGVDRPMCGGSFLDWQPTQDESDAAGADVAGV
jgi:hypothetical protein